MKQHITREQWNELSDEQKKLFGLGELIIRPSIGQMIEFLGDDLMIQRRCSDGLFDICVLEPLKAKNHHICKLEELADALWLAVKEKLNK